MRVSHLKVATSEFGKVGCGDTFMYNPGIVAMKCRVGADTIVVELATGYVLAKLPVLQVVELVNVNMSAKSRIVKV